MSETVNFSDHQSDKQRAEVLRAVQAAHERAKADEHCDPRYWRWDNIIYPWSERPLDLPLWREEIDLILVRMYNFDLVKAAEKLKMTPARLEAELICDRRWRVWAKQHRRERLEAEQTAERLAERQRAGDAAVVVESMTTHQMVVRIAKPRYAHHIKILKYADSYVVHIMSDHVVRMSDLVDKAGEIVAASTSEGYIFR
jgi:hypothetical protein